VRVPTTNIYMVTLFSRSPSPFFVRTTDLDDQDNDKNNMEITGRTNSQANLHVGTESESNTGMAEAERRVRRLVERLAR